ncbi:hypothetical protein Ancab_022835 [Ancistrocladus abbreviatus]
MQFRPWFAGINNGSSDPFLFEELDVPHRNDALWKLTVVMRILRRFIAAMTTRDSSLQFCQRFRNSQALYCNREEFSSNLIDRLIKEPKSRTKSILDSAEHSTTGKGFDFSWHTLIKVLKNSSTSKVQLALEWRLRKMLDDNERDQDLYSELIDLCGEIHNLSLAMNVFRTMESVGIKPTSDVFNSLIKACSSSADELTALSLFEIMENSEIYKPNSRTYNAFISMYSDMGNVKALKGWVSRKTAAGFAPDLQSYEALIAGCIKVNDFGDADKYYKEMISSGIIPNLCILEKMLDRFCMQGSLCRVNESLKSMLDDGWVISLTMAERLVRFYSEMGKVEHLEEFLQTLSATKQSSEVLSRVHCGIIKMHAVADRLDDMEYSVGRMLKQGISFKLADDVEKIISSYFRRAAYDRLELFLHHIKNSYKFTRSTYDLLIAGYRRAGLSEKLDSLLNDSDCAGFHS